MFVCNPRLLLVQQCGYVNFDLPSAFCFCGLLLLGFSLWLATAIACQDTYINAIFFNLSTASSCLPSMLECTSRRTCTRLLRAVLVAKHPSSLQQAEAGRC